MERWEYSIDQGFPSPKHPVAEQRVGRVLWKVGSEACELQHHFLLHSIGLNSVTWR